MQRLETRSRDRVRPANGSVSVVPPVTPRASTYEYEPGGKRISRPQTRTGRRHFSRSAVGPSAYRWRRSCLLNFIRYDHPEGTQKRIESRWGARGLRFLNALGLINAATNTELAIISSPRALPRATAGDRRVPRGRCGHVETLTSSQNLTVDAHRLGLESVPFRTFASASMKSTFRADALLRPALNDSTAYPLNSCSPSVIKNAFSAC